MEILNTTAPPLSIPAEKPRLALLYARRTRLFPHRFKIFIVFWVFMTRPIRIMTIYSNLIRQTFIVHIHFTNIRSFSLEMWWPENLIIINTLTFILQPLSFPLTNYVELTVIKFTGDKIMIIYTLTIVFSHSLWFALVSWKRAENRKVGANWGYWVPVTNTCKRSA